MPRVWVLVSEPTQSYTGRAAVHRDYCGAALWILAPFAASQRDQGILYPTSRMAVVVTRAIRKSK